MTIETLIDKQDNVEIIRDKIASILALETASQVALATTAGKPDPSLWAFRVYAERSARWENFPSKTQDSTPVVNVWWDSSDYDMSKSNSVERQKSNATINIDCLGFGTPAPDGQGGHIPGDLKAAQEAQRTVRLVRNILMAAQYKYLELQGTVWDRWIESISMLQPQTDAQAAQNLVAGRISFKVQFNEFSPEVILDVLETLSVDVLRTEDGEIVAQAEYDYTT